MRETPVERKLKTGMERKREREAEREKERELSQRASHSGSGRGSRCRLSLYGKTPRHVTLWATNKTTASSGKWRQGCLRKITGAVTALL